MPENTIKRRLQDTRDAALASDDGPIFSFRSRHVLRRRNCESAVNPMWLDSATERIY
jgi:hypothetical protein